MQSNTPTGKHFAERINALLPQTQCTKCGYSGCRPYAEAIAHGERINRCPPGGPETIRVLAELTGQNAVPLDPRVGKHMPRQLAVIREEECIGCTKCIQACPVDAIIGAPKLMHTVIKTDCNGCDLCVAPCPVDCIDLVPQDDEIRPPSREEAQHWQQRYELRQNRLLQEAGKQQQRRALRLKDKLAALEKGEDLQKPSTVQRKSPEQLRADIAAAVARTQARKQARATSEDKQHDPYSTGKSHV